MAIKEEKSFEGRLRDTTQQQHVYVRSVYHEMKR